MRTAREVAEEVVAASAQAKAHEAIAEQVQVLVRREERQSKMKAQPYPYLRELRNQVARHRREARRLNVEVKLLKAEWADIEEANGRPVTPHLAEVRAEVRQRLAHDWNAECSL